MLSVFRARAFNGETGPSSRAFTMSTHATRSPLHPDIAFVGGGNMVRSLLGGLVAHGHPVASLSVCEPESVLRAALARDFGIRCGEENRAAARAEVLVLAVKPQVIRDVCLELAPALADPRPLVLSIAAGVRIGQIESWLGHGLSIVRAMPNTPALVGAGVAGLHANARATPIERARAEEILSATGSTVWVEREDLLDAVTAVSGSGPAYCFLLMEAMEQAAIEQGLAPAIARELSVQTALGAARMARQSSDEPAELRARVTSPGGTTAAALEVLEQRDFRGLVAAAIDAATRRARALSHELDAS